MSIASTFTLTSPTQQEHIQLSPNQKRKLSFFQQPSSFFLSSSIAPSLNSINQIYNSTKQFITEIDNRISRSNHKKEMNQMKSSEKYHHMVKSYEAQIVRLKKRIKLEQTITNPTKQYINDMLNQLVGLRRQNQGLKKQLNESKHSNSLLRSVIEERKKTRVQSPSKDSLYKTKVEKLPNISLIVQNLKDSIDKYLNQRGLIAGTQTKFDRFLKQFKKYQTYFDLSRLLNQIDKWIQGESNPKQPPETLRLRYHLNHISPLKKSRKKMNSMDMKNQSTDFEQFTMPPQEVIYSTRKMIRKREHKQK